MPFTRIYRLLIKDPVLTFIRSLHRHLTEFCSDIIDWLYAFPALTNSYVPGDNS